MLSKRILYFVEDKIFFHCPRATRAEECPVRLRWAPNLNPLRMVEPFRDYKNLVMQYSRRVLTTQNDAFRAISGIIRRISENQQWDIVEGIPTVAFENMMLFRRKFYPLSRRHGFPSYSWLGWKGPLEFMEGLEYFDGWIHWHVRDRATGEFLPVERRAMFPKLDTQVSGTKASNRIATQIHPGFGLLPGVQVDHGSPSERTRQLHLPQTFSLLCFSTLAVFFAIGSINYISGTASIEGYYTACGKVTLDGLDEYPVSRVGEFIFLSKTIPSDDDRELLNLEQVEMYAVMLIEWQRNGVAERRGVGFIDAKHVEDSLDPGPVWKEIVLG